MRFYTQFNVHVIAKLSLFLGNFRLKFQHWNRVFISPFIGRFFLINRDFLVLTDLGASTIPGMKLLAIETATEACSAALYLDGEVMERYTVEARKHSERILPMMDELLAEAELSLLQLDALAFGRGPGAFTGVRIATGVIQGAAFAADLPVVPVSTLAALAQRHYRQTGAVNLLPAFDARMGELYWGGYRVDDQGLVRSVIPDQVAAPEIVELPAEGDWHGVGTGWGTFGNALAQRLDGMLLSTTADLFCSAWDVAILGVDGFERGEAVAPEQALPIYLRDQVASKPKPR